MNRNGSFPEGTIRISRHDLYYQIYSDHEILYIPMRNITEDEMRQTSLRNSTILEYSIKDVTNRVVSSHKTSWRGICIDIWKDIIIHNSGRHQYIMRESTFNFRVTQETGDKGFNWCKDIDLSVQDKDSNNCMKEIIHMIKKNLYMFDIKIQLEDKSIVHLAM